METTEPKPFVHLSFDGMTAPNPDDPRDVEWKLRYGSPTRQEMRIAAEMVGAYKQLVADPQRARNAKVAGIRRARGISRA